MSKSRIEGRTEKMDKALARRRSTNVVQFEASTTKKRILKTDAVIDYAKNMRDWPLLDEAIQAKIEEQKEFVEWWQANVKRPGQGNNADRGYYSVADATHHTQISQQLVSRWVSKLKNPEAYRDELYMRTWSRSMGRAENRGAGVTGPYEWYTPEVCLDAVRAVLGTIDLDPASSDIAQKRVKATAHFTREDDGLAQNWHGNVFLNPPYAPPFISQFADKICSEYESGRMTAGIMLTHNYTDNKWFRKLAETSAAICFTTGRVRFTDDRGFTASPTQGQAFFYFGNDADRFAEVFGELGFMMQMMRQ